MNTHKLKLAGWLLVFSFSLPLTADAYTTTSQTAVRITDDTVLYTITYRFGFLNRDLYMPIIAKRGVQIEDKSPLAGFSVVDKKDAVIAAGTVNGIVLTSSKDVEMKENQYFLPAGKVAEFTLVTLATIPLSAETSGKELSLLVTHLPFIMVTPEGQHVQARLNPSELQYYRTPNLRW